jgi:hypothetical protein
LRLVSMDSLFSVWYTAFSRRTCSSTTHQFSKQEEVGSQDTL